MLPAYDTVRLSLVLKFLKCFLFNEYVFLVFYFVYTAEHRFRNVLLIDQLVHAAQHWPYDTVFALFCGFLATWQPLEVFFEFWSKIYVFFTCFPARPTRWWSVQCPGGTAAGGCL